MNLLLGQILLLLLLNLLLLLMLVLSCRVTVVGGRGRVANITTAHRLDLNVFHLNIVDLNSHWRRMSDVTCLFLLINLILIVLLGS